MRGDRIPGVLPRRESPLCNLEIGDPEVVARAMKPAAFAAPAPLAGVFRPVSPGPPRAADDGIMAV
ncbi:MAG: hypothetical protein IBGAMO2_110043 [Arenicellales bacterium IbO2]|nr:MAG: hypothetical protein IBGAMO2_110043 [Arenicellales bacterium IbO2]